MRQQVLLKVDSSKLKNPLSSCPEGLCDGSGWIIEESPDTFYKTAKACDCIRNLTQLRFLGERFAKVELNSLLPRNEKQASLRELLMKQPSTRIFLYGAGGTGKTHFLAAVYNYWFKKRAQIKYLEDATLKDELRNAELNNDYSFVNDLVTDNRHIFFDDVGKTSMTDFHRSALYRFFNEAYKQNRHLFITANDPLEVLGRPEYWGAHVTRRIEDLCELVEF